MENIRNNVIDVLKQCNDPELPIDLWNLGLIYDLNINEKDDKFAVDIIMSLTKPGCTMGQYMIEDNKNKMASSKSISSVNVELTFDPPWNPKMMTEEGKVKLGL